jgi:hypothetical protein
MDVSKRQQRYCARRQHEHVLVGGMAL